MRQSEKVGELKKERERIRPVLVHGDDGVVPSVHGAFQYSTTVGALQEEIGGKFSPRKKRSVLLADIYEELGLLTGRATRVRHCGSFLEFRVTAEGKKLCNADFCRDRLCPMCNWRRSLKIFSQVSLIMNVLEGKGYRFLFLTLTVRNCEGKEFPKTVQMMYDGWRTLYHDYFRKGQTLKGVVCGTFRSLETTINRTTGQFHPHFHVILAVRPGYFKGKAYVRQSAWAEMWKTACGLDYKPVVDVRTVKPKMDRKSGEMSMAGAVAEVSKYAAKDADYLDGLEDDRQLTLWDRDRTYYVRVLLEGLTGRRLVDMTGCFREVKKALALDDAEDGDLVHVGEEELREDLACLIVRYRWRNGVYVESIERPVSEKLAAVSVSEDEAF